MPRVRPCIACGAPLDNDECATPQCPYNPDEDTKVHDAEFDYVEGVGENPTDDATFDEGPEMSDEEFAELLNDDYEGEGEDQDPKDPIHSDDLTPEQREQMWEQNQDNKSDKSDKQDDNLDSKANQDAQDADDRMDMGGGDEGDMDTSEVEAEVEAEKEKGKQLTEEDLGEDPSDDALDLPEGDGDEEGEQDDTLPPRPSGCKGDCKPTDDPGAQDGDPCPHCTAKQFKQEMKAEGKENLPEEKMESEWQDFLDNWEDEARGEGDLFDESEVEKNEMPPDEDQITQEGEGGQGDPEDAPEDYVPDPNDDDLPPRPQGCAGNCAENDDPNNDGDPCPHCTAKSFKDEMREEQEQEGKEFDPEELAERFQEMLQDRREKIEERQKQDRNVDDLLDDEPEEKPEPEPEDSERDQLIERVNKARDDFSVDVFIDLAKMDEEKLTEMFSAEELSDFGDVAENNNAHNSAQVLRELAEKMNTPPEDEMGDEAPDESEEDRQQNGEQEQKPELEEQEQEEGFKRKAKDLTVTQEKRFDNIVSRIAKKVEGTFGQTAEEIFTMPKSDGQFQGEDLSQAIQITSRGVIYWVTVSAAKDIDLS